MADISQAVTGERLVLVEAIPYPTQPLLAKPTWSGNTLLPTDLWSAGLVSTYVARDAAVPTSLTAADIARARL